MSARAGGTYEQARVVACAANLQKAEGALVKASAELAAAEVKKAAADRDLENAADKHIADPSSELTGKAVLAARDAQVLSDVPVVRARRAVEEARAAITTAKSAMADAEQSAAAAARAARLGELREQISAGRIYESSVGPAAKLMDALDAVGAAAADLDRVFAAALTACAEIRSMGEACPPISSHLLFRPIVERILSTRPERAEGILEALMPNAAGIATAFEPHGAERPAGATIARHFRNGLLDALTTASGRPDVSGEARELAISDLEALFSAPTYPRAIGAVTANRQARKKADPPSAPAAPLRSISGGKASA